MQLLKHITRETYIWRGSPNMGYVHTEIFIPLLLYHPTKLRDTTYNNPATLPLRSHIDSLTLEEISTQNGPFNSNSNSMP